MKKKSAPGRAKAKHVSIESALINRPMDLDEEAEGEESGAITVCRGCAQLAPTGDSNLLTTPRNSITISHGFANYCVSRPAGDRWAVMGQ